MSQVKTLLIADDHPIFRKGLIDLLQHAFPNVNIIECHNGAEAIDGILKQKPEVAILDINMPEANGLDVCKHVLKENTDTKRQYPKAVSERNKVNDSVGINALLSGYSCLQRQRNKENRCGRDDARRVLK